MKKKNFLNYVKTNQEKIYSSFNSVFSLSDIEFNEIIFQLLSINFETDDFYNSLYQDDKFYECFNIENLTNLRNFLMQIGLDETNLKRVINDVPEVILMSGKIECIYPLFKCDNFKGIALLYGDLFKSFMLPNVIDFYKVKRFRDYNLNIEYERLLRLEYYNQYENKETIGGLISNLERTDVMLFYGLSLDSSLKDKFDALASVFDQFNYYFLKPRNLLIERKAKQSAIDEDGMYCCDLCAKKSEDSKFLETKHVIPIHNGGKDDIYNLACLCSECQDRVTKNSINMSRTYQILCALKRRIYDKYPQYHNVMLSYYNMSDASFNGII